MKLTVVSMTQILQLGVPSRVKQNGAAQLGSWHPDFPSEGNPSFGRSGPNGVRTHQTEGDVRTWKVHVDLTTARLAKAAHTTRSHVDSVARASEDAKRV